MPLHTKSLEDTDIFAKRKIVNKAGYPTIVFVQALPPTNKEVNSQDFDCQPTKIILFPPLHLVTVSARALVLLFQLVKEWV